MQASLGKPSIIIGNDSRARMAEEIGLESVFVNDANFDFLVSRYQEFSVTHAAFKRKFELIKKQAFSAYLNLFRDSLPR